MYSSPEFCVFDVVPAVSALNHGINPHVEFAQIGAALLESTSRPCVSVEVRGLAEEVRSKSFVRIIKNTVLVGVAECRGVLTVKCNVPDEFTSLGTLGTASFLSLLVPDFACFFGIAWLYSGNAECCPEGFTSGWLA